MYDTPLRLQDHCLDYICDNISSLCDVQGDDFDSQCRLVFKEEDVFFHDTLSEQLLLSLGEKGKLTDETLSLFTSEVTRLQRVRIRSAPVTTKGLKVLKTHKITELEGTGLTHCTVNELISCLGEWTQANLKVLNVANSSFINTEKLCVMVSLCKLKGLHTLNVSNTDFNQHGLEIICRDLPNLENLDMSNTAVNDISPLRYLRTRLRTLSLYNVRASYQSNLVSVLVLLQQLRHLDISDDRRAQQFVTYQDKCSWEDLLMRERFLTHLVSLDLSGRDGLTPDLLKSFLDKHPHLRFMGLALTEVCEEPLFCDSDNPDFRQNLVVSGHGSEQQILESMRRYPQRPVYMHRTLFHLFSLTQTMTTPREDILEALLPGARNHPDHLSVQMSATACLYNLSKAERGAHLHAKWLRQIVDITMTAMKNFPNVQQLQKNALLTLCSDTILQDVNFDRFLCAKLVMECLCTFSDASMVRMSVAVCSILAAKIPTEQTKALGSERRYMRRLLDTVKEKAQDKQVDIIMKFTLSALWNLSDESPETCDVFLGENGLTLYMNVIDAFSCADEDNRLHVETKVLGLLNNLAEVKRIRPRLMDDQFIHMMRSLLKNRPLQVSYFAAGIISHLVSDSAECWLSTCCPRRQDIQDDLREAILGWEQPKTEMVAYRSFTPFFELLSCDETPEVQLWAVWAIEHVCKRNGEKYLPMLIDEGGLTRMQMLDGNERLQADVRKITDSIMAMLNAYPNCSRDTSLDTSLDTKDNGD